MQNVNEIDELIKIISKLPGLGPKSAKRIVLKLINNREELIRPMAKNLAEVYKNISRCRTCGSLKSNSIGCNNCENITQKYNKICVVGRDYPNYVSTTSTQFSSAERCSVDVSFFKEVVKANEIPVLTCAHGPPHVVLHWMFCPRRFAKVNHPNAHGPGRVVDEQ